MSTAKEILKINMQSILITGGDLEKRKEKANQLSVTYLSRPAGSSRQVNYQLSVIDTFILGGENSIGIDKVRHLEKWASRKPFASKIKVAIVKEGEKLTIEAQNALLKILEEPPKNTLIILTAPQETSLLPTLVSRCKVIKLKKEIKIDLSKKQFSQLVDFLITLLNSGVGERIKKVQEIVKSREEMIRLVDKLTVLLREILLAKFSQPFLLKQTPAVIFLSDKLSSKQIVEMIKNLSKTKAMLKKNVNSTLALEVFFLDLPILK